MINDLWGWCSHHQLFNNLNAIINLVIRFLTLFCFLKKPFYVVLHQAFAFTSFVYDPTPTCSLWKRNISWVFQSTKRGISNSTSMYHFIVFLRVLSFDDTPFFASLVVMDSSPPNMTFSSIWVVYLSLLSSPQISPSVPKLTSRSSIDLSYWLWFNSHSNPSYYLCPTYM